MTSSIIEQEQEQPQRKMVRFVEESQNQVLILQADDQADAERTVPEEVFLERKERRKQEADHCKLKGYGILIMDSFETPDKANVEHHMTVFAQLPDARGLERQVSRKHDWERREWRTKCIQNVLALESKLRYQGGWNAQDDLWEQLAVESRKASRRAKRFARRMAKADEWVALQQEGEMEDLEGALSLINEIRDLQLHQNYQTEYSLRDGGMYCSQAMRGAPTVLLQPSSPTTTPSISRRASYSGRGGIMMTCESNMSQSVRSINSSRRRKRRSLQKSASDRVLDTRRSSSRRASPSLDDCISECSTKSKPSRTTEFLKERWSSFKKLGEQPPPPSRGVDSVPAPPNLSPNNKSGRRSLMMRWNSWSITSQNSSCSLNSSSFSSLKRSSSKSLRDVRKEDDPPPAVVAARRSSWNSALPSEEPKRAVTIRRLSLNSLPCAPKTKEEEERDVYGANSDFDDSIVVFNRRRRKHKKRNPPSVCTLATLEESDHSYNNHHHDSADSSDNNGDAFFARYRNIQAGDATDFNASNSSLNLADLGLKDDDDEKEEESHSTVEFSLKAKPETSRIRPKRRGEDCLPKRRGEDCLPKAPPSTRWSSSMPSLTAMPEDEEPKEYPLSFGASSPDLLSLESIDDSKRSQLQKAEQWALQRSMTALKTVDENQQTLQLDSSITRDESARAESTRAHHEEESVSERTTTLKKSKNKFKRFLKRAFSSSKISSRGDETKTKTSRRGLLKRWTSSSALSKSEAVIVQPPQPQMKPGQEEALPHRRAMMLNRHSSSPAMSCSFSSKDRLSCCSSSSKDSNSRQAPERTASNSSLTVASRSTKGDVPEEEPNVQVKHNSIFTLNSPRNNSSRSLFLGSRRSRSARTLETVC